MTAQPTPFNPDGPKKAVNVSVNAELLHKAQQAGLDLSQMLERALVEATRDAERTRWEEENRDAIEAYNKHVERDGVFSDGLRTF